MISDRWGSKQRSHATRPYASWALGWQIDDDFMHGVARPERAEATNIKDDAPLLAFEWTSRVGAIPILLEAGVGDKDDMAYRSKGTGVDRSLYISLSSRAYHKQLAPAKPITCSRTPMVEEMMK